MSLANGCDGNLLQHFILISLIYDNFSQIEIKCCQKMGKYLSRNHLGNILLGLQVIQYFQNLFKIILMFSDRKSENSGI